MQDVIQVLNLAYSYNTLWDRHEKLEYFNLAETYYNMALEIGYNLPMPLLNLFTMYRKIGDVEKIKETGDRISKNWPRAKEDIERTLNTLNSTST